MAEAEQLINQWYNNESNSTIVEQYSTLSSKMCEIQMYDKALEYIEKAKSKQKEYDALSNLAEETEKYKQIQITENKIKFLLENEMKKIIEGKKNKSTMIKSVAIVTSIIGALGIGAWVVYKYNKSE